MYYARIDQRAVKVRAVRSGQGCPTIDQEGSYKNVKGKKKNFARIDQRAVKIPEGLSGGAGGEADGVAQR